MTQRIADAEDFQKLYNSSWSSLVSSATVRQQKITKLNKPVHLPLIKDITNLGSYLISEIKAVNVNYTRLQKLVLTKLVIDNGRRPAEVADLRVSDFTMAVSRKSDQANEELKSRLTLQEKSMADRYCILV